MGEGLGAGDLGGRSAAWWSGLAEQVVPILGTVGAEAAQGGAGSAQGVGGLVAGGIGVVAAQEGESAEGVQPAGEAGGDAAGGGDEGGGGQGERGEQAGGESVDGALDEEHRGGRPADVGGRQPEAAEGLAGAGRHAATAPPHPPAPNSLAPSRPIGANLLVDMTDLVEYDFGELVCTPAETSEPHK